MDPASVLDRYTNLAPRYDRVTSRWAKLAFLPIERYRRQAVAALNVQPGDTVLEIGCGTGLNFRHIQKLIGPEGHIIALDYTPAMMEQAARKVAEGGWQNVEFIRGDAAEVNRLVREPVDAVISTGCLCIVPGWERAIAGATDLLPPGGRLVILDLLSMKARGPLRIASPLADWWSSRHGFTDPAEDFVVMRPWKAVMERHLVRVSYQEMYMGMMFLTFGEKAAKGSQFG